MVHKIIILQLILITVNISYLQEEHKLQVFENNSEVSGHKEETMGNLGCYINLLLLW